MKKIVILAFVALFFGNIAFSQTDEFVLTWTIVEEEAQKSDVDITNAKKAAKINTWLNRGKQYIYVFLFDFSQISSSSEKSYFDQTQYVLSSSDISMLKGKSPKDTKTIGDTTILSYDRLDFYSLNDKIIKYARTERAKPFFPTQTAALDVATEAYLQANKLNGDGKKTKEITKQLDTIAKLYEIEATWSNKTQDYANVLAYYTKAANIVKSGLTNYTDKKKNDLFYNCGVLNNYQKNYSEAIEYFKLMQPKAINTENNIFNCQLMMGDTASAIKTLENTIVDFPNDSLIANNLNYLIQLYIDTKQTEKAIDYLQKAIEKEPNNTAYIFNLGYLHEIMNKQAEAIEYYNKAIAINANEPNANFNLGLIYAKNGNDSMQEADKLYGKKGYQAKKDEGTNWLKKACASFEISAQYSTDKNLKRNSYNNLMRLYAQLGQMDKSKQAKKQYEAL